jgi:glycosyltransferase 2 family protein
MEVCETNIPKKTSKSSSIGKTILGYAIAALCLVWVFYDVRFSELIESTASINWWWVSGAVAFDILTYACQGLRWSLLLHPIGRISTWKATEAIYAGLFVNDVLPMRLGEVLRIFLVSRWLPVPIAAVVPSILVERFFDAIWLALCFGITVLAMPLPKYLVNAEGILGFAALASTILFIYLAFRKRGNGGTRSNNGKSFLRPMRWVSGILDKIAGGVRDIGRSPYFYSSFIVSLFFLFAQILSFWFVMMAFGLKLSVWHGAVVFLIVHVGTVIPSAPSNLGTYQFFTVVGLTIFGINKTLATSFSIIVFLILTLPLLAIGMLVFGRLGLSLKMIQTDISSLEKD